ncbi:hypothetical protein [Streptomyces sp. NPDC126514]|uniref:hypothetical protein n=1 Tax=Streptomyces sp. NPDC126514 TaxID=3155210 RepID=UPI003333E093
MQLQRMPADGSGKRGFYQPGGVLEVLAEGLEENVLSVAKVDVERTEALLKQEHMTKHELARALTFLVASARQAVDVAECRAERLDSLRADMEPDD